MRRKDCAHPGGLVRAAAALLLVAGPLLAQAGPAAPDALHTLWIGRGSDPQTLDPAISPDNNDWTISYPCYQRLMRYKVVRGKGSTQVEGELAQAWTVSADHRVWEFQLREGQNFDDGSPVNAAAVKFSFDRLVKLDQGPAEPFPPDLRVEAVAPMRVRFTMGQVCPYFLSALANNGASILNPKVLDQRDAGPDGKFFLADHTAGSGAFRLVSWERSQSLVLEPNPFYGGAVKPVLRRVVFRIYHDPLGMRLLMENGDLDMVEDLPEEELAVVARKPRLTVVTEPSLEVTYLYLNNKRPPLSNVVLRQAISWAVDYAGIIKNVMNGQARQMRGIIPEGMWGHDPNVLQYTTDPARARDLVKTLGIKGLLHLSFLFSDRQPEWAGVAQAVQADLAPLGIVVTPEEMANSAMRDRIDKGDFDIAIGSWSPDFADPYTYMNIWLDSGRQGLKGNRAFYSNPEVDRLIREAATLGDQAARVVRYQAAQKIAVAEAAYVYLYQSRYRIGMCKAVKGLVVNPMLQGIYNLDGMYKIPNP